MADKSKAVEAAKTLVRVREILEKRGWVKGSYKTTDGKVCLLQALWDAKGPGENEARRIIYGCIGDMPIPIWNDAKERTYEDVKTVLAAAENIAKELAE